MGPLGWIVVILVLMWALGFGFQVGGGLIHLILIIAVIVLIIHLARSRPWR